MECRLGVAGRPACDVTGVDRARRLPDLGGLAQQRWLPARTDAARALGRRPQRILPVHGRPQAQRPGAPGQEGRTREAAARGRSDRAERGGRRLGRRLGPLGPVAQDGRQGRETLLDMASIPSVVAPRKQRLLSSSIGSMTALLSQPGRISLLDASLGEPARGAVQASVRARACRSLLRGKATWFTGRVWQWTDKRWGEGHCKPTVGSRELSVRSSFLDDLRSASMDSSAVVRRVAGEMLIGESSGAGAACRALAGRLAADASASVAERAEFPLKALDPAGTAS